MAEQLATFAEVAETLRELPESVRTMRRARRLSLRAAASQIGCSFSTLSRFESRTERDVGIQLEPVLQILAWLDSAPAAVHTEEKP